VVWVIIVSCLLLVRGHPKIFTTTRKLIHEGDIDVIVIEADGPRSKTYYGHLFNDAIIYSKRDMTGMFKLVKAIDLAGMSVSTFNVAGFTNTFTVRAPSAEPEDIFRCNKSEDFAIW
jgi:hypothetical protein